MKTITRIGIFSMQVCVPAGTTDDEVLSFAEKENPSGTVTGWLIRRQGDERLDGADARVQCESEPDHVHIMLDV